MKKIAFECTLLTDLVLSAEAATEGFYKSLDYIPGAKFLGIASKTLYDEDQAVRTLDLFHNGVVRYGDAHRIGSTSGPTYRMPFSWQRPKGSLWNEVYLYHELTDELKKELIISNKQVETVPPAYFTEQGEVLGEDQLFSIKSAYDSANHRAEDEKMYGYFALPSGSRWQFQVETDDPAYLPLIEKALTGKQRIGRSSSAEYGLIEIKKIADLPISIVPAIAPSLAFLYAQSNWCFYDDALCNTVSPDPVKHLCLPSGSKIIWEKSQVRTRTYKNWNRHRNNRDADRLIIEKGSVLAVQLSDTFDANKLTGGIGAYRAEGFGKVLINPSFLTGKNARLLLPLADYKNNGLPQKAYYAVAQAPEDTQILHFLSKKTSGGSSDRTIDHLINRFITEYAKMFDDITNSQWGQIKTLAKHAGRALAFRALVFKDLAFSEIVGACYKGKSESVWRQNNRRRSLEQFLFNESQLEGDAIIALAIKLSAEMAKRAN
jgi:hypothetical protein